MILLSIAIVIALLVTIVLPIVFGLFLNTRLKVAWRVLSYGALAYFVVQALSSLLYTGIGSIGVTVSLGGSEMTLSAAQIALSVALGALLGVLVRWGAMKYIKEDLQNLEAAYGIGVGYGTAESVMLVGLPLLATFVAMLQNINIDPLTTTLEPEFVAQIEELWQVSSHIPLLGALERVAAFVMHLAVTILILQVFKRKNAKWLAAAFGLELLVNGLIVGMAEAGVQYGWIILVSLVLMAGNLYLLYRLHAFEFDITKAGGDVQVEP